MDGNAFRGPSHFVIAFDPKAFDITNLPALMAQYAVGIRQGQDSIRLPGDNATAVEVERQRKGIPLSEALREEIRQLSDTFEIECSRLFP
jgi:LDH2 family malate/lactate/ureidoglycolate dehydrogenase